MKYKTEEMLSDNLTKVMTMPKQHVQKCGLNDIQVAVAAMVVASHFAVAEVAQDEDKHPNSEWLVLKAAVVLFLVGLFTGMFLAKKLATWMSTATHLTAPLLNATGTQTESAPTTLTTLTILPSTILIAPSHGRKYHLVRSCPGLLQASERSNLLSLVSVASDRRLRGRADLTVGNLCCLLG
jgi:hypothetical protein